MRAAEATAPHPRPGVESAKKNMLVGPPAALMDRVRDLIRDARDKSSRPTGSDPSGRSRPAIPGRSSALPLAPRGVEPSLWSYQGPACLPAAPETTAGRSASIAGNAVPRRPSSPTV